MKIAYLANPESPNGWYRGIGPMSALKRRGHEIRQVIGLGGRFKPELVQGCDVVHIHREHDRPTLQVARYAKENGIAVWWDNDDDLTSIPKNNPSYRSSYGGAKGARAAVEIRKMLEAADVVTTPSRRLAELYREMGAARVEVIENYVRDEAAASGSKRPADGRVVVGWVAGKEHHLDVERLPIRAALAELLERRPEVEIVTVGVGLGLRSDRYRHIPAVRFFDLPAVTREFDLGLAPIADIPLNRSRSNVKLKEYAAAGVPWLASPIGAYAALGKREGGRLVADDDWPRALDELIDRKRDRRKLAGRAFKWGSGETVSANVGRWERLLGDVVGLARPESDSVRRRISPRLR